MESDLSQRTVVEADADEHTDECKYKHKRHLKVKKQRRGSDCQNHRQDVRKDFSNHINLAENCVSENAHEDPASEQGDSGWIIKSSNERQVSGFWRDRKL